ncbi:MAG TPA: maleylpyruvate isomerase family mycothiol-dependent enzyme [Acidimicrobiia bacterium]|jgi:uncharacterized protein (TIGR03083 family)|nr:maleylpyruvate isomerase family mycothiol-dependent enzyme [Acidimicrobiia bacterium]
MDVTRSEFQDLVGAYALDACEPEEASAIDAYVAANPDAAAEAERLRDAAAWLGAVGARHPPAALRDRLLAVAVARVDGLPPVEALRRETERFVTVLDSLSDADVDAVTFNGLTVRELVAHVAIIDEAFVAGADETATRVLITADYVEALTRAELPATAGWSFEQICARFYAARRDLIDLGGRLAPTTRTGGYTLASALVIRTFETWTHHDDILAATGRVAPEIEAPVMHTMSELAIQTLPLAMTAKGYAYPGATARIVLTGPGGGDWTIAVTPNEAVAPIPHVVLRVPAVELCRRFADRRSVDEVPFEIEGDPELGRALVDAAPAFAGL